MRYPHVNAPRFVGSPNAMIYCTFFLPLQNINAPSKWNLSWFKLDERSNELFVADVNRNAVSLNSMGASEALGDPAPSDGTTYCQDREWRGIVGHVSVRQRPVSCDQFLSIFGTPSSLQRRRHDGRSENQETFNCVHEVT